MELSSKPTKHILVKANCQSEWDCCDFAVITCDDSWKKGLRKKLDAIGAFNAPDSFISFRFYDSSVEFYQSKDDEAELLSGEKEWEFVTLNEDEEESFEKPETRLEQGLLVLYKDGSGFYKAYGKYTGEEFYTAIFPIGKILDSMENK
ncbi:hypothetical protein [Dysgonomonas termitidis]|uniref:DUF4178 domain-containing protein n=1 Tax=Dysgonomonas termitidis TaxID=1516126 RepID=A0ABV9KXF2_9BACT